MIKCNVLHALGSFPTTTVEKVATNEWAISHFEGYNDIIVKHGGSIKSTVNSAT